MYKRENLGGYFLVNKLSGIFEVHEERGKNETYRKPPFYAFSRDLHLHISFTIPAAL